MKVRLSRGTAQSWTTPAGMIMTKSAVKALFTIPELQDDKMIEWNLHVTENLGTHDMIIGRDIPELLGVNILISDQTVQWGTKCMPFKDQDLRCVFHQR
jgi:hypothetical protein